MATDLFEQLADAPVPPVPTDLDARVRQRLNETLLATHLAAFVWQALPFTLGVLFRGVVHLVVFTLTGKSSEDGKEAEGRIDP